MKLSHMTTYIVPLIVIMASFIVPKQAQAVTRDQMRATMYDEDTAKVYATPERRKLKKQAVNECHNTFECSTNQYCHKTNSYDSQGVCLEERIGD